MTTATDLVAGWKPQLLIDGHHHDAEDGETFLVTDPATDEVLAEVASASAADAVRAVAAAHRAGPTWAATPPRVRGEILRGAFEAMEAHRDELTELIVREGGKSWADAAGEVSYAAEFLRWYAEEAVRAVGHVQRAPGGDKRILDVLEPVGVSVLITPWNFPAAMATRKLGPALAAGCTVVLKPASDTPLTALALAHLLQEAGVPPGVVNVLPSRRSGQVASAMLDDPRTRKLSFTGSTEVGRTLLATAALTVTSCSMELGGNGAFLVLQDADLDAAVDGAMVAKMRNGGESCIAANRFYVHADLARDFTDRLAQRMASLRTGSGMDRTVDVGPLINTAARSEVHELVTDSLSAGADLVTGGMVPTGAGAFYPPTVLGDVDLSDPVLGREIFGPVAPVVTFTDLDVAIDHANNTPFGLAGYVYSADLGTALRVAERLEVGMVGVNRGFVSDPAAPFGGVKQSGLGREGGHEGLLEFLEHKYISVDW